jgi:nucleoside-triphosphatase
VKPADDNSRRRPAILLTGRPGIGKTTVIRRLADLLGGKALAGFYTAEIRVGRQRQGFEIRTFSGTTAVLAHTNVDSPHCVGRYGVDVEAFEKTVLPELARPADVLLIDEIGKMECFSDRFVQAMRKLLNEAVPLVAAVALSGPGFIAEVKRRPDVELRHVTAQNRDELPGQLANLVAP